MDTSHPKPNYRRALKVIRNLCRQVGLSDFERFEWVRGRPGCVCSLPGRQSRLASVVLSSHTDVVPVDRSAWTVAPPFSARTVNQSMYARGSQDMKTQGIQYLEALRRLINATGGPGNRASCLERTVHVLFVPDEEVGGEAGMGALVQSRLWLERMNAGIVIDECLPDTRRGVYKLCYGERQPWWTIIRTTAAPGHGGTLPMDTAIQRIHSVMSRVLQFREQQRLAVENKEKCLGSVIGVNIVHVSSSGNHGAMNVIPGTAELRMDVRVPPQISEAEMNAIFEEWLGGACFFSNSTRGTCVNGMFEIEFPHKVVAPFMEALNDTANGPYRALQISAEKERVLYEPFLFPMSTDSRFIRQAGVPAFGLTALDNIASGPLLHQHNENVPLESFERGIQIYMALVRELANGTEWVSGKDSKAQRLSHLGETRNQEF